MKTEWRYILGGVTMVVIIGGTIYAIKKAKDAEKQQEETITAEEAKRIVEEAKAQQTDEEMAYSEQEANAYVDEIEHHKQILVRKLEEPEEEEIDEGELPDDPLRDDYPLIDEQIQGPKLTVEPLVDFYYVEEGIDPKEDKELRYHPDSRDAKHQYIRMELADWSPMETPYKILLQLFEFPFIPTNEGDEILRSQIVDYKIQFFGENSKWVDEISFAEVVLHYARCAEFEFGDVVSEWATTFLLNAGFEWDFTSEQFDTTILQLNSHIHFNNERRTFGLFGLSRNHMDEAIRIANRKIDRSVTYEIEFNEFMKAYVAD